MAAAGAFVFVRKITDSRYARLSSMVEPGV